MNSDVTRLCGRLAAAPAAFCAPVDPNKAGSVHLQAIVADLFRDRATRYASEQQLAMFQPASGLSPNRRRAKIRHLEMVLLASWLLYDNAFVSLDSEQLYRLLSKHLRALAKVVIARACIEDADRREELVRVCLHHLEMPPHGERLAEAEDRLASLDSVKRAKLLTDARKRESQRHKRKLEKLRQQEEDARRQAARATFED